MQVAEFIYNGEHYLPLDKPATAVCVTMSRMKLSGRDMLTVRSYGYLPRCDGVELGKVNTTV